LTTVADVHDINTEENYRRQLLDLSKFLNADIINDWMQYLVWRTKEDSGILGKAVTSWIIPDLELLCAPPSTLSQIQWDVVFKRVCRLTEDINWKDEPILLIPIHCNNRTHWALIVVNLNTYVIELWDSLHDKNNYEKMKQLVLWWLHCFAPSSVQCDVKTGKFQFWIGPSGCLCYFDADITKLFINCMGWIVELTSVFMLTKESNRSRSLTKMLRLTA